MVYFIHETALDESFSLSLNLAILIENLNPGFLLASNTVTQS